MLNKLLTLGSPQTSLWCTAAALLLLSAAQTNAQSLTATQNVTITGKYIPQNPPNVPDPRQPISDSYTGSSLGDSTYDFSSVTGIEEGSAFWFSTIDADGFVRAASDLEIKHNFGNGPDFSDLKVEVSSTVKYSDTLGSDSEFAERFVFQTRLTGYLINNVTYDNPQFGGASKATYETDAQFSSTIATVGLLENLPNQAFDVGETSSELAVPGPFNENVSERDNLNVVISFDELLYARGSSIDFDWEYSDNFLVDIESIDVGSIDIKMQNELRQTIVTTASVYDGDGNLLPDARVVSTSGYVYAPNPVPLPAAVWLFGSALVGLGLLKRKKA